MANKYLNRFSIEEDDQFEIHVKDYPDKWYNMSKRDFYNAAKEVILKAQQGQGYCRLEIRNYMR